MGKIQKTMKKTKFEFKGFDKDGNQIAASKGTIRIGEVDTMQSISARIAKKKKWDIAQFDQTEIRLKNHVLKPAK